MIQVISNMITTISMVGSTSLLIIGLLSVYLSKKPGHDLRVRKILYLVGSDILLVSLVRFFHTPFGLIKDPNSVTIMAGMIALVFLILIFMELVNKYDSRRIK